MSSGYKIDSSSSPHLDYGQGNGDSLDNNESSTDALPTDHKSYIDRSGSRQGEDKSLDMRKARKKNKRKKKKISERNTKEFNDGQADE
ncbi:hypothetical protein [Endozoicomonas sp. ONNA2]|uniref:hypothetical protein n=1 Tax=Endozoicomonas sp. ONNA2 TaxID=2828741 RepID=UPI002148AAC5|nr:hypothetical protein [Endozoicomonas sp. ONNA2]